MVSEKARKNHNIDILNSIYKTSKMNSESIGDVLSRCNDYMLRTNLAMQKEKYDKTSLFAGTELSKFGESPKEPRRIIPAYMQAQNYRKSEQSSSPSNLAKTVIEDTNMCIIELARTINRSIAADQQLIDNAKDLLQEEQSYSNQLKSYL